MLKGWMPLVIAFARADVVPLASVLSTALALGIVVHTDYAGDIVGSTSSSHRAYISSSNANYWSLKHAALLSD